MATPEGLCTACSAGGYCKEHYISRFHCLSCGKRLYWCRYCKIQHCSKCSPHPSRRLKYAAKTVWLRKPNGQVTIMAARKLAHLQGASKGGQVTATRPNPGRFTSATGRAAAQRSHGRLSPFKSGIRLGRARKHRPAVDRAALRVQYCLNPDSNKMGIWYDPYNREWTMLGRVISERTALQKLGHLPRTSKHWVPPKDVEIIKVVTGKVPTYKHRRTR